MLRRRLLLLGPLFFIASSSFVTSFAPLIQQVVQQEGKCIGRRTTVLLASSDDGEDLTNPKQQHNTRRRFIGTFGTITTASLFTPTYAMAAAKNSVSFTNVKDGDTVPRKFTYQFAVNGYTLSPAADGLKPNTGHHHLVIDGGPKSFVDKGVAIPFDDTHKHYGKAQTEGELELEPGKHTITLQFANANHESYGKDFAKTITVNVKEV